MSVNPLFSGPAPNKRPPIYNSVSASPGQRTANVLRQTNLNAGSMNVRDSPGPRKKPRMGDSGDLGSTDDGDPFQDFDSFTEDDLESCDMIASQALSQQPCQDLGPPAQALKRPASTPRFPSRQTNYPTGVHGQVVNKMSAENDSQACGSYVALQHANTSYASTGSRFSFKSTNSRGGRSQTPVPSTVSNRTATPTFPQAQNRSSMKQSNVTGTKIYYSSPYRSGSTSPYSHQLGENVDSAKVQTLRSSMPAASSKQTPQTNNGSQIVTSASKPEPQLGIGNNTGPYPTRNVLQNPHGDLSNRSNPVPYSTKPGAIPSNASVGGSFHAAPPQRGGCDTTSLTPPKGAVARESPGLPTSERETGSCQTWALQQQQMVKYRSECEAFRQQLKQLNEEMLSKNGEIQVLRQNLSKAKVEANRLQMERLQAEEQKKQQMREMERELRRENESLKAQLQFKEVELMQVQSASQNHRTRPPVPTSSANNAPATPPKQHPMLPRLGKTEDEARDADVFPTQKSFMADNPKVERGQLRSPRVRTLSESLQVRHSPKRSPRKGFAVKSPGKASPAVPHPIPAAHSSPSATSNKPPSNAKKSCRLSARFQTGSSAEAQLVSSLLQDPEEKVTASGSVGGLMGLVQSTGHDRVPSEGTEAALPGEPSPAKPKRVLPSKRQALDVSEKNHHNLELATRAISNILNPPRIPPLPPSVTLQAPPLQPPAERSQVPETRDPVTYVTDLLPLLEDQLTAYIDATHSVILSNTQGLCSTCLSSSSSGSHSLESSPDSCGSSSPSEDFAALGHAESAVLTSLALLRRMLLHSSTVRTAVLHTGTFRDPESPESDEDASAMEIDPSAPLIDPTQAPSKSAGHSSVVHDPPPQPAPPTAPGDNLPEPRRNRILSKLMRIASMQHGLGNCWEVVESSLDALRVLVQKSSAEDMDRLDSLLVHNALYNCMSRDSTFTQVCRALDILKALSSSWKLTAKLCNQSDSCLLLQCYQCGVHGSLGCRNPQKVQLTVKVISLLWGIIGTHHQGATLLLDTDCQCSVELVNAVVLMLKRILDVTLAMMVSQRPTQYWRHVLHECLLLLHCLAMHDRHFADHRLDVEKFYVAAVTSLSKRYHRLPGVTDNETGLVQDLWDFIQWDETEGELEEEYEENEEEQEGVAKMEMDQ
ncbi:uncharacterized protein DDB_G0284459-like isoform X2 [Acanthaster planci]|uniref:Uncharacterized protein DDB_G0284459-like isoform X2 n=1 Tax=Acanthaster planci TaxID=133434 RepID=A0A8B7XN59_ACAPL|nr:uncharacterized protein DDB_G0284459-like isoform X2 [Acanthaster planci]